METHTVKIKSIDKVTHDVLQIVTDKPRQFAFIPGQATEISINKEGWINEGRPFTFTSLPENDYLQFIIKTYPSHRGVTRELLTLAVNDELILTDIFGAIAYQGEGVFIAGGAGITPFVSIFRQLHSRNEIGKNKLIFANKTRADIILEPELTELLGENFINILSHEEADGFEHGFITEDFLRAHISDFDKRFYVCGPPPMMDAMEQHFGNLNVSEKSIIKEAF